MKLINILNKLTCVTLSFLALTCTAQNMVKYYEPVSVDLTGTIKILTFPGPPNYEDTSKGDIAETCPYIILDHPIDVETKSTSASDSEVMFALEKDIKFVQLVVSNESDWRLMKDGARVNVKGELFEAFTGHHRTRVLLDVSEVTKNNITSDMEQKKICVRSSCLSGIYDIVPTLKENSDPLCFCFSVYTST